MKSYKEISDDIRSNLSSEVTGMQLDILVNVLSMYVYDIQATAVSQLLENNLNTAININSIISKASQLGVSVPRNINPEVEFEVKSVESSTKLRLGDEVISIGKFKFIYLGYYSPSYLESECEITSASPTLIRCVVTDKVHSIEVSQTPGEIYDYTKSDLASKVFAYKDDVLMRVYDSYSEYLTDISENKLLAVTQPSYGVRVTDYNSGDVSTYSIKFLNSVTNSDELMNSIKTKAASSKVTVSRYRSNTEESNIRLINLGTEVLDRDSLVSYVEKNLKLTQLIKSNSDIEAFFTDYLIKTTGSSYSINPKVGRDLVIYVGDKYFIEKSLNELIPRFYLGLDSITLTPGVELTASVSLELNNAVNSEVSDTISGYIHEYDGKFETLINEYDLTHKINSINLLIRVNSLEIAYTTDVRYGVGYYRINLSDTNYDIDVPNLDFNSYGSAPDPNKTYKLYTGKDKYIKTSILWK